MLNRTVTRVGAAGAMVGAVIAVVFNILHPRPEEVGAAEIVRSAAEEGIWALDHYMLGWAIGLALLAFIVLSRSLSSEPSTSWGRVALIFGIGSTAVAFALIGVDGFAIPEAAEASGPETALAVAHVGEALLVATIAAFFGLTPILFGIAVLSGDDYPGWMGWVAIVAGVIGIVTASIMFFDGLSSFTIEVLFPIASLVFTLWIGVMGYLLWQKTSAPTAAQPAAPSGQPTA